VDVLKGVGRKSTTATVVVKITSAINELLFTQVSELVVLNLIVGLYTTNGRESPATTALTLVLDGCNSTNCSPVPMLRVILKRKLLV